MVLKKCSLIIRKIIEILFLFCLLASSINLIGIIVASIQGDFDYKNFFFLLGQILFYITGYTYVRKNTKNKRLKV